LIFSARKGGDKDHALLFKQESSLDHVPLKQKKGVWAGVSFTYFYPKKKLKDVGMVRTDDP
jgi:hypothetical protein